ncbi:MAG: HD domain-containing protein [Candidatus Limnocylindrales bacterium]
MAHPRFEALNLISDPIHGYLELTKRLTPEQSALAGLEPEDIAEEDLLDTPWVQRLRRISQLQSARWVFPTAEHSRFTHGLGVMHEAGLWGRALYPTLRDALAAATLAEGDAAEHTIPSQGLVVETLRVAGLLHDVGHGPFAHFFDDHVLTHFPAPAHPSRDPAKRLSHEDLGQAIVERELAQLIRGLRRAPAPEPADGAFAPDEVIEPRWISFLISKPPLADATMPLWVRRLQPLFSGIFTVDNLDYVRRDAYLTGVATGPIDADRLRRYCFISEGGLTLYEPGLGALEMFLTARLYLYNTIYFHRTVRAIDLDLEEVFGPSIRALFGDADPLEALEAYADLDEYALLHQASRWARGERLSAAPTAGDGRVTPRVGALWRGILLRRPTWHAVREVRRDSRGGHDRASVEAELRAVLGPDAAGAEVRLDLAEADARPQNPLAVTGQLLIARRDGSLDPSGLGELLERLPAVVVVGRAYRRVSQAALD